MPRTGRPPKLSMETLQACLTGGMSDKEIAEHANVSLRTVQEKSKLLRKTHAGRTALSIRDRVETKSAQMSEVLAAIPEAPTAAELHAAADRALLYAVSMVGTRESLVAAGVIKDKVELPATVEEKPTADLIAAALAASRTAVEAARKIRAETVIDAEATEPEPDRPVAH